MLQRLLIIIGVVLLVSCATFTRDKISNLQYIHDGQTSREVAAVLGQPSNQVKKGKAQIWYYRIYADDSSRVYSYVFGFFNDRLQNFGMNSDLRDLELREKRQNADQSLGILGGLGGNGAPRLQN